MMTPTRMAWKAVLAALPGTGAEKSEAPPLAERTHPANCHRLGKVGPYTPSPGRPKIKTSSMSESILFSSLLPALELSQSMALLMIESHGLLSMALMGESQRLLS